LIDYLGCSQPVTILDGTLVGPKNVFDLDPDLFLFHFFFDFFLSADGEEGRIWRWE
jgi:hypothetical protein